MVAVVLAHSRRYSHIGMFRRYASSVWLGAVRGLLFFGLRAVKVLQDGLLV